MKIRRGLSAFLSILLVFGVITAAPLTVSAAEEATDGEWRYTVENGSAVITGYDGYNSYITIPDYVGGYPVDAIGDYAFANASIESVCIGSHITELGEFVFEGCSQLYSVEWNCWVDEIPMGFFSYCTNLHNVYGTNNVRRIGERAFSGCYSMEYLDFSEYLSEIDDYAFDSCSSTLSLYLPDSFCESGSISPMAFEMFYGTIYGVHGYAIDQYKRSCAGSNIVITDHQLMGPYWNWPYEFEMSDGYLSGGYYYDGFYSYPYMDGMVTAEYRCERGGWEEDLIFEAKLSFDVVFPPTCSTEGRVMVKAYVDDTCSASREFTADEFPYGIILSDCREFMIPPAEHRYEYIPYCEPYGDMEGNIDYYYCPDCERFFNMEYMEISKEETIIPAEFSYEYIGGGWAITAYNGYDMYVNIPEYHEGMPVVAINSYAFLNHDTIESVTIPESVNFIGDYAFAYCYNLKDVHIGENVGYIGDRAFENCTSLYQVIFDSKYTEFGGWSVFGYDSCYLVIYGLHDSTAEHYAKENGINFMTMDEHIYDAPEWEWSEDYSSATAIFNCISYDDTQTVQAQIDSYKEPEYRRIIYVATVEFNGFYHYDKIEVEYESRLLGDVNGDGVVNIADATMIQRVIAGIESDEYRWVHQYGDVNGGGLDISDVTEIQRYAAKMNTSGWIGILV